MRALHQLGHHIPRDMAVMGFDDIPVASFATPALSTIQQDTSLAGEMLVDNVLRLINNQAIVSTHIQPKLIIRQSCGTR